MHKKLEAELASLAHSILEMKNNNDVAVLQKKAQLLYEKLTVLNFVEANLNMPFEVEEEEKPTPNFETEELESVMKGVEIIAEVEEEVEGKSLEIEFEKLATIEAAVEEEQIEDSFEILVDEDEIVEELIDEKKILSHKEIEEIVETKEPIYQDGKDVITKLQFTLEDEFKDAISADVATELFERVTKENPVIPKKSEAKPEVKQKSLNDTIFSNNLQIGLNDRIAFVKHLFDNSQADFNRVLSQLNSFKTVEEAKDFLENMVKPDYNWEAKQDYEARLIDLVERKYS